MGDKSAIEWTDATWNPVTGCTKVSPGCANCYAERLAKRLRAMGNPRYRNGFAVTLHPDQLTLQLRWTQPRRIFVNSMSDLFHDRAQLMAVGGMPYVRAFEMLDKGNHTEYFLFFGTKNLKGFSKMKESMWRADPVQGRVFSDLTDPNQQVLLEPEADVSPLRQALGTAFKKKDWISIDRIANFVLTETPYSELIHLKRRTLAPMEKDGLLKATRPHGERRAGTYPDGTFVQFE